MKTNDKVYWSGYNTYEKRMQNIRECSLVPNTPQEAIVITTRADWVQIECLMQYHTPKPMKAWCWVEKSEVTKL